MSPLRRGRCDVLWVIHTSTNSFGRLDASQNCGCNAQALLQNELNSFRQSLIKGMLSLFEEILDKRIEEKMDLGLDNIYFEVIQALQHRADK